MIEVPGVAADTLIVLIVLSDVERIVANSSSVDERVEMSFFDMVSEGDVVEAVVVSAAAIIMVVDKRSLSTFSLFMRIGGGADRLRPWRS